MVQKRGPNNSIRFATESVNQTEREGVIPWNWTNNYWTPDQSLTQTDANDETGSIRFEPYILVRPINKFGKSKPVTYRNNRTGEKVKNARHRTKTRRTNIPNPTKRIMEGLLSQARAHAEALLFRNATSTESMKERITPYLMRSILRKLGMSKKNAETTAEYYFETNFHPKLLRKINSTRIGYRNTNFE
jgi:hypothetical protein